MSYDAKRAELAGKITVMPERYNSVKWKQTIEHN
jgi:hypothetical protein